MMFVLLFVVFLFGIVLGLLLFLINNKKYVGVCIFYWIIVILVNVFCLIFFIILIVLLLLMIKLFVGIVIGLKVVFLVLIIFVVLFYGWMVEIVFCEVDKGVIEVVKFMGVNMFIIIGKVFILEVFLVIIFGIIVIVILFVGFIVMVGVIGVGGFGNIVYFEGF